MATPKLEQKTEEAEEMIQCGQRGCRVVFPEKEAHYLPTPTCPVCYERWFYDQD